MTNNNYQSSWFSGSVVLVALSATVALLSYSYQTIAVKEYTDTNNDRTASIAVPGTGEVLVVPDIGKFSFSVVREGVTASEAQASATKAHNEIISYLKEGNDILETDIKTVRYDLRPRYRYLEPVPGARSSERELIGYEVSHRVEVIVRDLDESGKLLVGVGEYGASNISNLTFTIDDESKYLDEARDIAIVDAKARAERLAEQLGVSLVRIIGYDETGSNVPIYSNRLAAPSMMSESDTSAPVMPVGEDKIFRSVTIEYEVR